MSRIIKFSRADLDIIAAALPRYVALAVAAQSLLDSRRQLIRAEDRVESQGVNTERSKRDLEAAMKAEEDAAKLVADVLASIR